MVRLRPKNGSIVNYIKRIEGTDRWVPARSISSSSSEAEIWYTFEGKVYRTRTWPVIKTGFVIPWTKSSPEYPWFHSYAGPKRDFHGGKPVLPSSIRRFPHPYIEFTRKGFRFGIGVGYLFRYDECTVTNMLNQTMSIQQT